MVNKNILFTKKIKNKNKRDSEESVNENGDDEEADIKYPDEIDQVLEQLEGEVSPRGTQRLR